MPEPARIVLAAATGYLLGSVSFALLLARARGVDLRAIGSGNLGATNAGRALGTGFGVLVLLLDAGKGAAAAGLGLQWQAWEGGVAGAAGALAGHLWPVLHGFRGGKGLATLIGGTLVLAPWATLAALGVLGLAVLATRYMSLGALLFGLTLPAACWLLYRERSPVPAYATVAGPLLWYTHRANIGRLLHGTELRLGRKKHA